MSLKATGLRVRLGQREVLRGIDLSVRTGETVAIVGPNGSGKSTLVRTLAGLQKPESGAVAIGDHPVARMRPNQRASALGLLTQSAQIPGLTLVREHVGLGRHSKRGLLGRWTHADEAAVREAMHRCGIAPLADRRMEELSGGERQRVRLATLLAQGPDLLMLDEPLNGLDIEHQLDLLGLLVELNTNHARTIVCVLHDLSLAMRFFERVIVINEGRIAADGPPSRVLCPRVFETVFRVEGRVARSGGGEPIVVCSPRCAPGGSEGECATHRCDDACAPEVVTVRTDRDAAVTTDQLG